MSHENEYVHENEFFHQDQPSEGRGSFRRMYSSSIEESKIKSRNELHHRRQHQHVEQHKLSTASKPEDIQLDEENNENLGRCIYDNGGERR